LKKREALRFEPRDGKSAPQSIAINYPTHKLSKRKDCAAME
jgi:hypothetical protein